MPAAVYQFLSTAVRLQPVSRSNNRFGRTSVALNRIFHLLSSQPLTSRLDGVRGDRLEQIRISIFLLQQFADSPDDYVMTEKWILMWSLSLCAGTLMYEQPGPTSQGGHARNSRWFGMDALSGNRQWRSGHCLTKSYGLTIFVPPQDRINPEDWRFCCTCVVWIAPSAAVMPLFICGTGPKAMSIIPGTPSSVWKKPAGGFIRSKIQLARCRTDFRQQSLDQTALLSAWLDSRAADGRIAESAGGRCPAAM